MKYFIYKSKSFKHSKFREITETLSKFYSVIPQVLNKKCATDSNLISEQQE